MGKLVNFWIPFFSCRYSAEPKIQYSSIKICLFVCFFAQKTAEKIQSGKLTHQLLQLQKRLH